MQTERTFLWVTPEPVASRELIETTAREFNLTVRFCVYDGLFNLMRSQRCDLIGIEFGEDPEPGLALTRELHERLPRMPVLAASADNSVSVMRQAIEAGACDFIALPLSAQELHKALIKLSHQPTVVNRSLSGEVGEVITLCGARGGLGVTTLAVNLAVRLTALTGTKVALVDLDLQRGDVSTFLNLQPTQSLATIAGAHGEVDELFLYSTLTRHPSGVFVMAAPTEIEDADSIGHDDVVTVLELLRARFRYTIIDTARMLTAATLAALEQTDRVLVLTDLSVPGVRAARRTIDLLGRLTTPAPRVDLLVTEIVISPVGLTEAVRAIGKEPFMTIPRDEAAASRAVNAGAPLNGTKPSSLKVAIEELAAKLAGVDSEPKTKRGLLQRIFTKGASV